MPRRKQRFPGQHSWIYRGFLAAPAIGHPKGAAPAAPWVHPPPQQSPRCVLGAEHPVLGGKTVSGIDSPHFPSTPGSEELIAHPLPKFPPVDTADGGRARGTPSSPLCPTHPQLHPLFQQRGGTRGGPSIAGKNRNHGEMLAGKIRSHQNVPACPICSSLWGSAAGKSPPKVVVTTREIPRAGTPLPTDVPKSPPGGMRSIPLVMGLEELVG